MPKAKKNGRNAGAQSSPYNRPAKASASNHIFKMKTDIGQHVLKNPGVADVIVAKSDLKQSDVGSDRAAPNISDDEWTDGV